MHKQMNPIFAGLTTSVFETMSARARETQSINLGQGFPDDPGPLDVRQKAADAVINGWNQYPPMMGLPELRQARAAGDGYLRHFRRLILVLRALLLAPRGGTCHARRRGWLVAG
jgi:hypothetical protein